ncbi:isochorismatase family protein [Streptosporangiaceae bacterium NEAU-GS5]|nr:isochorismatase family protein [Streptosporangiaceae bacterium NEAU-GS5]
MPLTSIDPRTALVLIDLQRGITAMLDAETLAPPVTAAAELAAAFRAAALPVVLVRVGFSPDGADAPRNRTGVSRPAARPPAGWTEPLPELNAQPSDLVVTKRQPGAFYGTDLDLQLRRRGVTGIVLGGFATSLGVESTARAGYDHGYNVTFASDAMADFTPAAHLHSLTVTFPFFGEVDTTAAIISALG